MKYKISEQQFSLLSKNLLIIEGGLSPIKRNIIKESSMREYLVSMWISSYPAEIRIGTNMGSGGAMAIARKLFPHARVFSAKSA